MAEPQYKTTLGDRLFDMVTTGGLLAGVSAAVTAIGKKIGPVAGFVEKNIGARLPETGRMATFVTGKPIMAAAAITGALGALYSLVTYSKKNDIEAYDEVIKVIQEDKAKSLAAPATETIPSTGEKQSHASRIQASRAEASQRVTAL